MRSNLYSREVVIVGIRDNDIVCNVINFLLRGQKSHVKITTSYTVVAINIYVEGVYRERPQYSI